MSWLEQAFGDLEQYDTGGFKDGFDLLPDDTKVLVRVNAVAGKVSGKGNLYAEVESQAVALPAGLPSGNYGTPRFWDRKNFVIPEPAARLAGQPEDTVARYRKRVGIFIRRLGNLGLDPKKFSPEATEASVTRDFSGAIGRVVGAKLKREEAVLNDDGTEKYPAKNVVDEYYEASPSFCKKYGLTLPENADGTGQEVPF